MLRSFFTLALLVTTLAIGPSLASAAPNQSVVVVDLYRAFTQTKEGKNVLQKLEKELKTKQAAIEKKQQDLVLWKEDTAKKFPMLSDSMKAEKQAELEKRVREYGESVQKLDGELKALKEKLEKPVLQKLNKALKTIATREEFDVILDASAGGVIWARPALDITDQLVREFGKTK